LYPTPRAQPAGRHAPRRAPGASPRVKDLGQVHLVDAAGDALGAVEVGMDHDRAVDRRLIVACDDWRVVAGPGRPGP
jgi:hypothetical protein